jgi:GTPase SAR1 family protein
MEALHVTEMFKNKKILMLGLDNAGKTSIILNFTGNRNLLSYMSLEPTTGVDITNLPISDTTFHFWELGGQESVRMESLAEFNDLVAGTFKIIYVIDVQDVARYSLAIDFFDEIVKKLVDMSQYPEIIVFLHKFDPMLEDDPEFAHDVIQDKLVGKIQSIVGEKFSLVVYKTTIFALFQKMEF